MLGVFGTITNMAFTLVMAFFLAIERKEIYRFAISLLPNDFASRITASEPRMERTFLVWLRGQALLSLSIFVATYLGLYALDWGLGISIRGHFSLAFIAGLCEFVPVIGPLLAAIPALIIAIASGPLAIGAVAMLYFLIQELENLFLVPRIQGDALELSTFTVLLAMAVSANLFGIVGVIFTLPVLAACKVACFPQAETAPVDVPKPKKSKK